MKIKVENRNQNQQELEILSTTLICPRGIMNHACLAKTLLSFLQIVFIGNK